MNVKRLLVINQPQTGISREIGLETGLTQKQFAVELSLTYSWINRWEHRTQQAVAIGYN